MALEEESRAIQSTEAVAHGALSHSSFWMGEAFHRSTWATQGAAYGLQQIAGCCPETKDGTLRSSNATYHRRQAPAEDSPVGPGPALRRPGIPPYNEDCYQYGIRNA
uniref:Uncharacterized protein n=1 Tax=Sphaerodactylus townsendi TaxID=933632 RepID=A0ACB8FT56_9SAUR